MEVPLNSSSNVAIHLLFPVCDQNRLMNCFQQHCEWGRNKAGAQLVTLKALSVDVLCRLPAMIPVEPVPVVLPNASKPEAETTRKKLKSSPATFWILEGDDSPHISSVRYVIPGTYKTTCCRLVNVVDGVVFYII
jgi:hypothetical protein